MSRATDERDYKKRTEHWVKKREEFEKRVEEEGAHTLKKGKYMACLSRSGPYRENGYFYIKDKTSRRDEYDLSLSDLGTGLLEAKIGTKRGSGMTAGSKEHAKLYKYDVAIEGGKRYNFMSTYVPYRNEAHHLLPIEAVPTSFKGKTKFLGKLPYNINHGENIIFLPKNQRDTRVHKLPQHSGSHKNYNNRVKTELTKIASRLTAKEEEYCKPEDPPPIAVLDDMIKLESQFWKVVVNMGADAKVNQRVPPDPPE